MDGWRYGPPHDWSNGVEPLGTDTDFAVRWTGQIEAKLSEPYVFLVYKRGRARLWIDGKQRVFAWNAGRNRWETEPIELESGQRYSVQLDFAAKQEHPACSLN